MDMKETTLAIHASRSKIHDFSTKHSMEDEGDGWFVRVANAAATAIYGSIVVVIPKHFSDASSKS